MRESSSTGNPCLGGGRLPSSCYVTTGRTASFWEFPTPTIASAATVTTPVTFPVASGTSPYYAQYDQYYESNSKKTDPNTCDYIAWFYSSKLYQAPDSGVVVSVPILYFDIANAYHHSHAARFREIESFALIQGIKPEFLCPCQRLPSLRATQSSFYRLTLRARIGRYYRNYRLFRSRAMDCCNLHEIITAHLITWSQHSASDTTNYIISSTATGIIT